MSVAHSTLTTTDLHEPKGAAAASAGQVYIADGAGSGTWTDQDEGMPLFLTIDNVSLASSHWVVSPISGTIGKIYTVLGTIITTGDAIITAEIGGTLVTDSSLTIAYSGSAVGDVDSSTPSAANTVAAGGAIEIITDGGSTVASKVQVTIFITPT